MSSYLLIGGLSPISLRGIVPQLLEENETKKIIIYDDLSGGASSASKYLRDSRVSLTIGSTFNEQLIEKVLADNDITHVIDLASLCTPNKKSSPIEIARTSVVGFTHVIDAVRHYGQKPRFVLVSRQPSSNHSLSESTPPIPSSLIAANAMSCEAMLHSYVISYRMPLVVARLSEGVIAHELSRGPNTKLFDKIDEDSNESYSIISLRDAARGIIAVLNKGVGPEIYNIGGAADYKMDELLTCVNKVKSGSCCSIPPSSTGFPIDKAEKELGWTPEDTDLCKIISDEQTAIQEAKTACKASNRVNHSHLLVYGVESTVGAAFIEALQKEHINFTVAHTRPGADSDDAVRAEIINIAPSNVVCIIDRAATVTYNEEPRPARLHENVRDNLYSAWILASICERVRCHFTYITTLTKCEEDEQVKEEETSYSAVKKFTAKLIEQFPSALQIRIPPPTETFSSDSLLLLLDLVLNNSAGCDVGVETDAILVGTKPPLTVTLGRHLIPVQQHADLNANRA